MWHFLLSHALAVLFWVPVAWGLSRVSGMKASSRDRGRSA